jgi:hypothetical protein
MAMRIGPPPPLEVKGFLLLLLHHVEGIVELAQLVVDQRMRREAVLRKPRAMKPIPVKRPLEKAGLNDGDETAGQYPDREQMGVLSRWGLLLAISAMVLGNSSDFDFCPGVGQNADRARAAQNLAAMAVASRSTSAISL